MKIALASDHAGYEQLKEIKKFLEAEGHNLQDYGPKKFDSGDDYPDFIYPAARAVASGQCRAGIILGRSGQGEAMVANRVKGVRAAVFYGPAVPRKVVDSHGRTSHDPYEIVKLARSHNDANMLSLAASFVSLDDMKQVIRLWLETPFSDEPRHNRRIKKIDKVL